MTDRFADLSFGVFVIVTNTTEFVLAENRAHSAVSFARQIRISDREIYSQSLKNGSKMIIGKKLNHTFREKNQSLSELERRFHHSLGGRGLGR